MKNLLHNLVAASALFVTLSASSDLAVAVLYSHGVARLNASASIENHDVRLLARPVRVAAGQHLSRPAIEEHLRRIGYYESQAHAPGCYQAAEDSLTVWARYPELTDVTLRWNGAVIAALTDPSGAALETAMIEPQTVVTLAGSSTGGPSRVSSTPVPLARLLGTPLLDAVIASEDRWFETHHGLDLTRLVLAPLVGGGGSTITMQVARLNVLQDRSRTIARKMNEIGLAMAIERRYSKDAILSSYINSVYLGATHGRRLHGFGAAARELFGVDDLRDLTPLQAATLVALLNQPSRYLDGLSSGDDTRLRRQRNRVLRLMHKNMPLKYSDEWVRSLEDEPVAMSMSSAGDDLLHRTSRYYLDYALAGVPRAPNQRVYLTLDADLQAIAFDVVQRGLSDLDRGPRRSARHAQAALIATNVRTGEVLAMIGGRSYDDSQFNRAISAERQVGSIMKPFDYLAAFERAADDGADVSPATLVLDEPTEFRFPGLRPWKPANYENHYAGSITWQRALAESRNVAAVKVATWAGIPRVAALWQHATGTHVAQIFPSMTLGAIQATPADVARAYAAFATGGLVRPLRAISEIVSAAGETRTGGDEPQRVAREQTSASVADMMRAVLNEGTGRSARAAGLIVDAAGKTGTTDELRDAWFAGFSGDLLAVVWVGRDDAQPLGLTGAQAALPIWTAFMLRAAQGSGSAEQGLGTRD